VAFAEQFIYLCLRHLTVLLWSARNARYKHNKERINKRGKKHNNKKQTNVRALYGQKYNDRGTIKTSRLSEDNFYADRISGGNAVFSVLANRAGTSRRVPFVGGALA